MSWGRVILFALIAGVYTGVIKIVPVLKDTSFQDIAVTLEWWFLFAVIVIVNCEKWWEAALKCFVFFLISQPLAYLVQVPFNPYGWGIFDYYPYWFRITLLTLPGAVIAFLVKKKNLLSVLILSVATGYLAYQGAAYFYAALHRFPFHLLSSLACVAIALLLILGLTEPKLHRRTALGIFLALLVIFCIVLFPKTAASGELYLGAGGWVCSYDDPVLEIREAEDGHFSISTGIQGTAYAEFTNEAGEIRRFLITVSDDRMTIEPEE